MKDQIIERAFDFADKDSKGYLNKQELKISFLCLFGFKPSKFDDIFHHYGKSVNEQHSHEPIVAIKKDDFINLIHDRLKFVDEDDEIREIFHCFDMRCKGFIDVNDFKEAVRLKFPSFDDMKILRYFRELDGNSDGRVSYQDFCLMMKSLRE